MAWTPGALCTSCTCCKGVGQLGNSVDASQMHPMELSQLSLGTGHGALSAKLMLPALLPFLNILRVVLRSDGIVAEQDADVRDKCLART